MSISPILYKINLSLPCFPAENSEDFFNFCGAVSILIKHNISNLTNTIITLQISDRIDIKNIDVSEIENSNDDNIDNNELLYPYKKDVEIVNINREIIDIRLPNSIPQGYQYYLNIKYIGSIALADTEGFYGLKCPLDMSKWIFLTHCEPIHCRKIFPCFDQPDMKAKFQLTITYPSIYNYTVVSNTSIEAEIEEEEGSNIEVEKFLLESERSPTYITVRFETTPILPTYNFGFWLLTEYEKKSQIIQFNGKDIVLSAYVSRDKIQNVEWALNFAAKAFTYFLNVFNLVPYPLHKLDFICVKKMNGLAMENFAAISILEEYFLVDDQTTYTRKRRIKRLICHEISHQYLGNIVTPFSFDDLWLKESLARFFEYLAVDSIDPEEHIWTNFNQEIYHRAMLLDAGPNSHPVIQYHNGDIGAILESFDRITYGKGASILRMLCEHIGKPIFIEAIQQLVFRLQYRNASKNDMWYIIQEVSSRAGIDVDIEKFIEPWLHHQGFPLITFDLIQQYADDGNQVIVLVLKNKSFNSSYDIVETDSSTMSDSGLIDEKLHIIKAIIKSQNSKFSSSKEEVDLNVHSFGNSSTMDDGPSGTTTMRTIPIRITVGFRDQRIDISYLMKGNRAQIYLPKEIFKNLTWYNLSKELYLIVNNNNLGYFCLHFESDKSWEYACNSFLLGRMSENEMVAFTTNIDTLMHIILDFTRENLNKYLELNFKSMYKRLDNLLKVFKANDIYRASLQCVIAQGILWDLAHSSIHYNISSIDENLNVTLQEAYEVNSIDKTVLNGKIQFFETKVSDIKHQIENELNWYRSSGQNNQMNEKLEENIERLTNVYIRNEKLMDKIVKISAKVI